MNFKLLQEQMDISISAFIQKLEEREIQQVSEQDEEMAYLLIDDDEDTTVVGQTEPIPISFNDSINYEFEENEVYTYNVLSEVGLVVSGHTLTKLQGTFDPAALVKNTNAMWFRGERVTEVDIPSYGYDLINTGYWSHLSIMEEGIPRVIRGDGSHIIRGMAEHLPGPDCFIIRFFTNKWYSVLVDDGRPSVIESTGSAWLRTKGQKYVLLSHMMIEASVNVYPLHYFNRVESTTGVVLNIDGNDVHIKNDKKIFVRVAQIGTQYIGLSKRGEKACDLEGQNIPIGSVIEYDWVTKKYETSYCPPDSKEVISFVIKMPLWKDFPQLSYPIKQIHLGPFSLKKIIHLLDCEHGTSSPGLYKQKANMTSRRAAFAKYLSTVEYGNLHEFECWLRQQQVVFKRQRPYHVTKLNIEIKIYKKKLIILSVLHGHVAPDLLLRFGSFCDTISCSKHHVVIKVLGDPAQICAWTNHIRRVCGIVSGVVFYSGNKPPNLQ